MARAFIILSLYFFTIGKIVGQPFVDLINIKYQHFPGVNYPSDSRKMTINEYIYSFTLPIELKNKNVIIAGAIFDEFHFNFSDSEIRKYLYGLTIQVGYLHYWNKGKWKTLLMALPKVNADKLILSSNSFQQGGIIITTYQKRKSLAYKFGLYYNPEFFGNFIMPLVGIEWKPVPKLNIYGMLPANGTIEYKITSQFYSGISYSNLTQSYRLHGSDTFVRNGDKFWGNMQWKLFANYYLKKSLVLFIEGGYTLYRRYEAYNDQNELISHPYFTVTKNGPLVNLGIAIRIRTDQITENQ